MSTVSPPAPRRIEIFDGLRGLAIILVVLSHGWTLWPNEYVSTHRPLSTLFGSGNFAVSIFFVVGAFVATQGMLRKAQSPEGLHPVVDVARRYVRLTGQVGFMLLVLLLVLVFDDTDVNSKEVTQTSVLRVLSYSWNWYLQDNALNARPDIGHLWYLSVYLQAMVLVVFIVWLLRRRPVWLPVTLGALLLATELWTAHVYESEGVIHALLRTSVRIDAPLTGALAASLLSLLHPRLGRYRAHLGRWCVLAAVALLPLAYLTTPNAGYFSWPGLLTDARPVRVRDVGRARAGPAPALRDARGAPAGLPRQPVPGSVHLALPGLLLRFPARARLALGLADRARAEPDAGVRAGQRVARGEPGPAGPAGTGVARAGLRAPGLLASTDPVGPGEQS